MATQIIEDREVTSTGGTEEPRTYRVLCIDGGGMRGIYTAAYLDELGRRYAAHRDWNSLGTPIKDPNTRRFEQRISEVIGCKFELDGGRAVSDFGGNLEVLQGVVERLGYRENQ